MKHGLSRDAIKYLAVAAMTLNHIASIFLLPDSLLYLVFTDIGYFTAITMCYFLVEGFYRTSDVKRYALRLFCFGTISQLPFYMAFHAFALNGRVMILNMQFSLLLCLLTLMIDSSTLPQNRKMWLMLLCYAASCFCDWPGMAVAFTFIFYRWRNRPEGIEKAFWVCAGAFALGSILQEVQADVPVRLAIVKGAAASTGLWVSGWVIGHLYNGKRGRFPRFSKWFFYIYYPAHLILLTAVKRMILLNR